MWNTQAGIQLKIQTQIIHDPRVEIQQQNVDVKKTQETGKSKHLVVKQFTKPVSLQSTEALGTRGTGRTQGHSTGTGDTWQQQMNWQRAKRNSGLNTQGLSDKWNTGEQEKRWEMGGERKWKRKKHDTRGENHQIQQKINETQNMFPLI